MPQKLFNTVKKFGNNDQHALVIGDVMLDRYLIGNVDRISPEAPVPIILLKETSERAGGAANVAVNLALLGIKTHIIGCIGNDTEGETLKNSLSLLGVDTSGMIRSTNRPTIAKTRILGGHQQMLRLDQESQSAFNDAENIQLLKAVQAELALKPSIVTLSDYAKGLLSDATCQKIIKACKSLNIPVLVDPKGHDYTKYQGATALTPNKKETAEACETHVNDNDLIVKSAILKKQLGLAFLAVTRGEEGITLIDESVHQIAATAQQVFDVSGAGDTVIATLAAGLLHDLSPLEGLQLANLAAGVVVGKVGTVPIIRDELLHTLAQQQDNAQAQKVCNLSELMSKVAHWKSTKQAIVFTNGC